MVTAVETTSKIAVHMGISFAIMFVATGSAAFGGLAAIIEPVCVVLVMPLHDQLWKKIRASLAQRENRPRTVSRAVGAVNA